jgi:hypothetical protein
MAEPTLEQVQEEMRRQGIPVSTESVMDERGTTSGEFLKGFEAIAKGIPKGVLNMIGGWGNLYDLARKSKDPNVLSTAGLARLIKDVTGVDILTIPGYRGAYEFGEAGAPATAFSLLGVPGLFSRSPAGLAGEFGAAGTTSMAAQQIAPESPLVQMGLMMAPYGAKAMYKGTQGMITKPRGTYPTEAEISELLRVGRITPGEASLFRNQLATEARVAAAPESGQAPVQFRIEQARDVESFLTNLFERAAGASVDTARAQQVTGTIVDAFKNYGKTLSGKLRSDAKKDFNAAKASGGQVDTTPIVDRVRAQLASLVPEDPTSGSLRQSLDNILKEYVDPGAAASVTPSAIVGPTGQPASVNITPARAPSNKPISIGRLQDNLAIWGEAAYSGKADFGKGNIFENVAPGKAKGIALSVLRGFKESLDEAINNNIPGADKLKAARDNFAANIDRVEEFAERPLTKAFDVQNVSQLVPEDVLNKLKRMPPSQRAVLIDVMQNSPNSQVNGVLETLRRAQMDDVLSRGRQGAAGASALDPEFSLGQALRALQRKGDLADLFPNPTDLADAQLAVKYLQRVMSKESAAGAGGVSGGAVFGTARGGGANPQQALLLREITNFARSIIASPEAFSKVIFDPNNRKLITDLAKGKTKGDRAIDALNLLKRGTLQVGTRGVASSETTPTVVEERSLPALEFGYDRNEEPTLEQVQEIMRQQGIPTEQ